MSGCEVKLHVCLGVRMYEMCTCICTVHVPGLELHHACTYVWVWGYIVDVSISELAWGYMMHVHVSGCEVRLYMQPWLWGHIIHVYCMSGHEVIPHIHNASLSCAWLPNILLPFAHFLLHHIQLLLNKQILHSTDHSYSRIFCSLKRLG